MTGCVGAARDADPTGLGVIDPATMSPTRKATVAVNPSVTRAKRRDMLSLYADQEAKRGFVERSHTQRFGLCQLAARVGTHDNVPPRLLASSTTACR
jgi:hypothetical protein